MAYRSERFPAGDMHGMDQAWQTVDQIEAAGLLVRSEIMSGTSYRRQPHKEAVARFGVQNYILQVVFQIPQRSDGRRYSAVGYIDESRRFLGGLELPGDVALDEGGLNGWDPVTYPRAFGSTGDSWKDLLEIYPPWVSAEWEEASRTCMFFCGIEPPSPKGFNEVYPAQWSERQMRAGHVVFEPTPADLQTY